MKKFLAVLLALVFVFSLAACGTNGGGKTPTNNTATELAFPKNVTVYIPQAVNTMVDQTSRIMVDYLKKVVPDTKFDIVNADGNGNDLAKAVAEAPGDGSVLLMIGPGTITSYYTNEWDYNLADTEKFIAIAGNVGQEQPSGGVFLINANETRFHDIPSMIEWIKANPGKLRCSWGTGTPHEIRLKLILDYYGIKSSDVVFHPGSTNDVRTWIQGGNTDLAVMTEATSAQDVKGGKVKGILNSVCNRDLYTPDLEPIKDVPIVTDLVSDLSQAEKLICAWPMTIYGSAKMPAELVEYYNKVINGFVNDKEFMDLAHTKGATTTFQVFTVEEINAYNQQANTQIKEMIERFK